MPRIKKKDRKMTAEFILRLFVAGFLGAAIGLEREYRAKEAGYRTHFLVSLGSALLMIISQYAFYDVLAVGTVRLDPSRVAAQVVTGIGFIGAGTIIFQKQIVRGLTTAAGIWTVAGIGMAIGAGMYVLGICSTLLVLAGLELLHLFFRGIGLRSVIVELSTTDRTTLKQITTFLSSTDYKVVSYEMVEEKNCFRVSMVVKFMHKDDEGTLLKSLQDFNDVTVHRVE